MGAWCYGIQGSIGFLDLSFGKGVVVRSLAEVPRFEQYAAVLRAHGYLLDAESDQVHVGDERALLSKNKLVLLGCRKDDGLRIVSKVSLNQEGAAEIEAEQSCRHLLDTVNQLANQPVILFPRGVDFFRDDGADYAVSVFIDQPSRFLDLPLSQRISLSIGAFQSQLEATRVSSASSLAHKLSLLKRTTASDYQREARELARLALDEFPDNPELRHCADAVDSFFSQRFASDKDWPSSLTQTDFVPNNFRVSDGLFYFIDLATFRWANALESWARYLNWLMIWDQELESSLLDYLGRALSTEDKCRLSTMRALKNAFLMHMYSTHLRHITDNPRLWTLQHGRLKFWTTALIAEIQGERISSGDRESFAQFQRAHRSERETRRQLSM